MALMGAGFNALNRMRKGADLCALAKAAGLSAKCDDPSLFDLINRKALCELLCCCQNNAGPAQPGKRREFQGCVAKALLAADAFNGFKGFYKPEVSFLNGAPLMSGQGSTRPNYYGAELLAATSGASGWRPYPENSLRPDVVVVKDPSKPPTLDNIHRVYEMKFDYGNGRSDRYTAEQENKYNNLFGQENIEVLTPEDCGCDDGSDGGAGDGVLVAADAAQRARDQAISLVPQINREAPALAASIVTAPVAGGVLARASQALRTAAQFLGFAY